MTELSSRRAAPAGESVAPPCTLVIFGAGGDLTRRLLIPSVYNLARDGLIDEETRIVGVDLVQQDDQAWRDHLTQSLQEFAKDPAAEFHAARIDQEVWGRLMRNASYVQGDFGDANVFETLRRKVGEGNAVFYMAVAARFFGPLADQLGRHDLMAEPEGGFRRMVVEKPFGADLASARELNGRLLAVARENQIFRIDHFLGKETVQSIMAVRFANGMLEPLWRREYVDSVQITAAETVGVEQRGAFYEHAGALRDMVPNHLFQLICMVAMEPPARFSAEAIRDEKSKLMAAIHGVEWRDVVRGQYIAGRIGEQDVPGYRDEHLVARNSQTETYVAMKLAIENWRWAGVPFYLRTGKRMKRRRTEIAITFRPAPLRLFTDTPIQRVPNNVLTINVDPEHSIKNSFAAKAPGPAMHLGAVSSSMRYADFFPEKPNVGYETLLYDCMLGDATLFQRADAIETAWAVVAPALEGFSANEIPLGFYGAGSDGPDAADELLKRDHRHWSVLD